MPRAKKRKESEELDQEDQENERVTLKRQKQCPYCSSENIIFDTETEQLICQDCGSMFEELVPVE